MTPVVKHAGAAGSQPGLETDSLQADVMRFMAIIAFCLIAILMLVEEIPEQGPESTLQGSTLQPSIPKPSTSRPSTPQPHVLKENQKPEAVPEAVAVDVLRQDTQPIADTSTQARTPVIAGPGVEPLRQQVTEESTPVPAPAAHESSGVLTLQFASERIFMRLIRDSQVQLFAGAAGEFSTLTPVFGVEAVTVQGTLYEVLPHSLPVAVQKIFPQAQQFLVRLPATTMSDVAALSNRYKGQGGELVIEADARVHYRQLDSKRK